MAEFIIKRISVSHPDPVKDLKGCYKRGDIIQVSEDGETANAPHLTVIKVPGLKVADVEFYQDCEYAPMAQVVEMPKEEYEELQTKAFRMKKEKGYTILETKGRGDLTVRPTLQAASPLTLTAKNAKDPVEVDAMVVSRHTRRRYGIPSVEMDKLFSDGKTVVEMTISEWNKFKKKMVDKK